MGKKQSQPSFYPKNQGYKEKTHWINPTCLTNSEGFNWYCVKSEKIDVYDYEQI